MPFLEHLEELRWRILWSLLAVLVGTIVGWAYALDWLAYRYPETVGRLVHPKPRELVRDGRLNRRNLARELISDDELMTQLRLQGVQDLSEVKVAAMEGNGQVSVVKRDPGKDAQPNNDPRAGGA